MFWRMAWRNLWRRRTRTLTMASAVGLSYALFLVSMGMGDDSHQQMLDAAVEGAGGEVLIHARGYWASRSGDLVIREGPARLAAVEGTPGVGTAIPRVLVQGLVSTASGNQPLLLQGVAPERERALRDIPRDLSEGRWLGASELPDPLVLGAGIVEKLELELGDRVVLTASGPDGELTRALFHLAGVLRTGMREVDETVGFTTLEAAQAALGMEGMLTQIGVVAQSGVEAEALAAEIEERVGAGADGLEVLPWKEALPEMVGFIEVDDAFLYIFVLVIFAVVAFAIANTFLMAVMERVREFGLLSALGLRGAGVARLLLAETLLLTLLAMAAGFLLGYGGHLAIDHWGIPIALWGVEEMELSGVDFSRMVMRSSLNPLKWALASLGVAAVTVGSALYPAWRAARLAPAEAMRFYE